MTTYEIVGHLCGLVTLVLSVIGYQMKEPKNSLKLFAPSDFFYGLQYYFLGSFSSFLIMMAAVLRDIAGIYGSKTVMRSVFIIYIGTVWVLAFLKAEYAMEYLPPLATTLATLGMLNREHFLRFRVFLFLHHVSWMIFSIWIMAYAGILLTCLTGGSNIIGFLRHYKDRKPEKSNKETPAEF